MVVKVLSLGLLVLMTSTCHVIAQDPQTTNITAKLALPVAPAAAATPKVEATPPTAAALDQLMTALEAAQTARSFRARLNSQINAEDADELTLEVAGPFRRRIKGHNLEIIVIGEDGYLSFGGRWQKAPRDPEAKAAVFKVGNAPVYWGQVENQAARAFITIKSAVPTTYHEQAAMLFEYEMKDAFGKTGVCTLRTWVSQADGLPRKTEMEGDYDGRHARATLTWLEYNAALTIEAPVLP